MEVEILTEEGSLRVKVGRSGCPEQACLLWTSRSLHVSRRCSVGTARSAGAYKRSQQLYQHCSLSVSLWALAKPKLVEGERARDPCRNRNGSMVATNEKPLTKRTDQGFFHKSINLSDRYSSFSSTPSITKESATNSQRYFTSRSIMSYSWRRLFMIWSRQLWQGAMSISAPVSFICFAFTRP